MANQPWQDDETLDPIGALLDELTDPEEAEEEFRSDFSKVWRVAVRSRHSCSV